MKRTLALLIGFLVLLGTEIFRVYFIMPFPGSQHQNSIDLAYFIHRHIWWFRILGILLVIPGLLAIFRQRKKWPKILLSAVILVYVLVFYFFNFRFLADKMFYQPTQKLFASAKDNAVDTNLLAIGVVLNGEARAYPIKLIGYHHQVQDTISGTPVMVTYCTVCRTGRVFSPFVDGVLQHFRLVGMDHFNAMFEDEHTGSWWRQVNGEAIAGPLRGQQLQEIASSQMRIGTWIRDYPEVKIMQPDPVFAKEYADLSGYDSGTIKGGLEHRDSASWKSKSWVVGVVSNGQAKAYDWNELVQQRVISDQIGDQPILLCLEEDGTSFHAMSRTLDGPALVFQWRPELKMLIDTNTHSTWSLAGFCVDGNLRGQRLRRLAAYQEFWHSWQFFHPNTTRYGQGR